MDFAKLKQLESLGAELQCFSKTPSNAQPRTSNIINTSSHVVKPCEQNKLGQECEHFAEGRSFFRKACLNLACFLVESCCCDESEACFSFSESAELFDLDC